MQTEQAISVADPVVSELRQILATNLNGLVDNPDPIVIETQLRGTIIDFRVLIPLSDVGKVIGVKGRMARALRTLMGASAAKHRRSCTLNLRMLEEERVAA